MSRRARLVFYVPPLPISTPSVHHSGSACAVDRGKGEASLSTGRASFSIRPALHPTISSLSSFHLKCKTAKMHELPSPPKRGAHRKAPLEMSPVSSERSLSRTSLLTSVCQNTTCLRKLC